jgi:hypothetical protein
LEKAAELVRLKVDVCVGGETGDARHSDRDGRRGRSGRHRPRRKPR